MSQSSMIEIFMYQVGQLFLLPVLSLVALLFVYALYVLGSFTVQALSGGSTTVTTGSSVQITQGAGTYFVYATCTQNGTTSPVSATTTIRVQPNAGSFVANPGSASQTPCAAGSFQPVMVLGPC